MAFIAETWAEKHLLDVMRRQVCHSKPLKARLQRLRNLEATRKEIMNHQMSQTERLAKLELLRDALDRL